MFTTSHQSVHVSVLLSSLLSEEKEHTRRWLRTEMDRLVEPLVNSIFHKITNKLMDNQEIKESWCGDDDGNDSDNGHQPNPPHHDETLYVQMHRAILEYEASFNQLQNENEIANYEFDDDEFRSEEKARIETTHHVNHTIEPEIIKEEEDNQQTTNTELITVSNQTHKPDMSLTPSNEQHRSNHNLTGWEEKIQPIPNHHQQNMMNPSNQLQENPQSHQPHSTGYRHKFDPVLLAQVKQEIIEEQNEMMLRNLRNNAQIEDCDEYEQEVMSEYQIDHIENDMTVQNVMDTTENQLTGQQIENEYEQVNNVIESSSSTHETQIIAHSLQCPQVGCELMFPQIHLLTAHLWNGHSISSFRCLLKDCRQSFDNKFILGEHIKQSHQSTSQWHCGKCDKHYTSYRLLSRHTVDYHQLGHFECSVLACTFTGEYKGKVYSHYATQHKTAGPRTWKKCDHSDCHYQTTSAGHLKQHQRVHLGIKPYRCKWSQCGYASTWKCHAIDHIRCRHLARKPSSQLNGAQSDDPNDYLEVVKELLNYKASSNQLSTGQVGHPIAHLSHQVNSGNGFQKAHDDEDNYQNAQELSRLCFANPPNQSPVIWQSARVAKRKQTEEEQTNQVMDNQEQIEGDDEKVTSWSVKRARPSLGSTKQNNQLIAHSLQCTQVGCTKVFLHDSLLTEHLLEEHSIGPFQCLVKDCRQSFDNSHLLSHHLAQSHQSTTEWHCDKCDQHLTSYHQLSVHNYHQHQLGHFECSFPTCTFTGECKGKVYSHYARQHKQSVKCQDPGCHYETSKATDLKRHIRVHLGIKPYRCKCCDYASTEKHNAISHIFRMHLTRNEFPKSRASDFLDVVHELL